MNRFLPWVMVLAGGLVGGCDKSDDAATKPSATPAASGVASAPAQVGTAAARPTSYPATTQPGRILVGDLLGIYISDLTGPGDVTTFPEQVESDGTVSLPYLAKPLTAAGLPAWRVEQDIIKAYHDENVIQRAEVEVRRLRIGGTGGPPPGPIANYDLMRIAIWDLTGPGTITVRVGRVDGEGMFSLPYVGRQKLAGLTCQRADASIAAEYGTQNIAQHALVSVLRLEAAPPDAGKVDLPDVAIEPVPEALRWLYEPPELAPPLSRLSK